MNASPLLASITHTSHLANRLIAATFVGVTLLTASAALADVVTVERLRCDTAAQYGDVHIYRAGKLVTSPSVDAATMGLSG